MWPSVLVFHAAVAVLVNVWFPLLHHRRSASAVGIGGSDVEKPGGSVAAAGFSSPGTQHEFCQNEEFRAMCGVPSGTASAASGDWSARTSVVVMTSAYYGLMSIGRCVRKDYGFVGCGSVVLNIADRMCSGRRNCTVRVPNADMDGAAQRASCPDEFKNYLNVSYQCVDVISAPRNGCRQPIAGSSRSATSGGTTSSLPVITKPQGTFASIVTAETECGSHLSPWRVEVSPGQRLNFTLVDFAHSYGDASTVDDTGSPDRLAKSGSSSGDSSSTAQAVCYAYAVFREGGPYGVSKSYTLCGGLTSSSGTRETTAYVSITEKVQLSIISRGEATDGRARHFLLRYTVIGCATPTTPLGGWVRRHGDQVTIGCNYTTQTWSLTCLGSKWIGTVNNCTIPENSLGLTSLADGSRLTFELALAAVVFIALLIAGVILCVGVAWIRRQAKRHSAAAAAAARGDSGRGPVTAGKLDRCLELHMPTGRSGQTSSGGVGQDGGQTGYGMLPGASGRSPYGSHFRSIDSSDYIFRGGTGGDAGYDSTMTAPARTPLSLGGGSDFYRANSSSNDYAYIQDFGPPLTSSSSTSQQQMPPPTSSSSYPQRSAGMPNFPQTAIGTSVMIAALDGSGGDVVHRVPTCSDSMKRADSFGRIDENPPPSRSQHQQQLLRQPLLHQYRAFPPQGAGCSDPASGGRIDLWERQQQQHPQHRMLSSAALASFSPANEHCFDQE